MAMATRSDEETEVRSDGAVFPGLHYDKATESSPSADSPVSVPRPVPSPVSQFPPGDSPSALRQQRGTDAPSPSCTSAGRKMRKRMSGKCRGGKESRERRRVTARGTQPQRPAGAPVRLPAESTCGCCWALGRLSW
ncbi:hypothetical protein HJG60_008135 [Phyllostomus discolor]|uniref:Uncharacterized protein n=1 Tax=Phyllostomus discolor TaxID=89673 RepID=A0A834DQC2_9CHIR|nr:hypothetical protein HJG60_008135 [Phyllostomus discolor]